MNCMTATLTSLRKVFAAYGIPITAAVGLHGVVVAGVWSYGRAEAAPPVLLNSFEVVELPSSGGVAEPLPPEPIDLTPVAAPEPEELVQVASEPRPIFKPKPPPPPKVAEVPRPAPVTPSPTLQFKPAVMARADAAALPTAYVPPSQSAVYSKNPKPVYPLQARRYGWEGRVVLRIQVDAEGRVKSVAVENGSGRRMLDDAAREAVLQWRFAPARRGGQAVEGEVLVPFDFQLKSG